MSMNMDKSAPVMADTQTLPALASTYTIPRVNLLPPEIAAEATFRRTQVVLGGVTLAVIAALAGGWAWSQHTLSVAQEQLATENQHTQVLAAEEAKYAEVPKVLNAIVATENAREQAMSPDVAWYTQLDMINREFPESVSFKTLTMVMNAAPGGVADPLATPGAIGTITVEGTSVKPTHVKTAEWLEAMTAHPGFIDPYYSLSDLAAEGGRDVIKMTTTVKFTDALLTHRFERKAQ